MSVGKKTINYDATIKVFFTSVVDLLEQSKAQMDTAFELEQIIRTQQLFQIMSSDPKKYIQETYKEETIMSKDYREAVKGLSLYRNEQGRHNINFYLMVNNVLFALIRYYEIPTSASFANTLEQCLKDYFVTMEPSTLRKVLYKVTPAQNLIQKISTQKTK